MSGKNKLNSKNEKLKLNLLLVIFDRISPRFPMKMGADPAIKIKKQITDETLTTTYRPYNNIYRVTRMRHVLMQLMPAPRPVVRLHPQKLPLNLYQTHQ